MDAEKLHQLRQLSLQTIKETMEFADAADR
jgi:hypothetical protein